VVCVCVCVCVCGVCVWCVCMCVSGVPYLQFYNERISTDPILVTWLSTVNEPP